MLIAAQVVKEMMKLFDKHYPNEVGSSLVGDYSEDGFDARVMGLVPLSSDSKGSRFAFIRGVEGVAEFFRKLKKSTYKKYYLGEWHTHPDGAPFPSTTDDANQQAIADDAKTQCHEAVLVILGGSPMAAPQIGVYVYSRKYGKIELSPDQS